MKKPLKIFLGDLTYDTVTLATEAFPLNIGFIASYCIKRFGSDVEITLFKYIRDIDRAVNESPPAILGMSNYCWSHNVSKEMFRMFLKKNPNGLTIWGGPNFPVDVPSQQKFMDKHQEVDVYIPVDGETGFSNVIKRALEADSEEEIKKIVLEKPTDGAIIRDVNGKLQFQIPAIRLNNLDEIPSPYLNGLLDEFFDGKLTPMLQTNRGCPFHCTFCTDGKDEVNQVNSFSLERVNSDIKYIANHVPKNTHSLHISDLNFGMYPRDLQVCDTLAEIQKKYHYPQFIKCTTGKNQQVKIIKAIKKLSSSLRITMSVQSLDKQVLANIRRSNISVEHMLALYPAIKEADLQTTSEVILGLPGETYENHIQTLRDLVKAKMDEIVVHTCMMLDGAEMNIPRERKKWNLKTKFRPIQRDFAELSNGKRVIEIEEVVVGSKTLSFDEYLELRLLAFIIFVTNKGIVYDPITKFLREQNLDVFDLFYQIMKNENNAPKKISKTFKRFKDATINELWDAPEQITTNYQKDSEYQKLLNGEAGTQIIYHFLAVVVSECMDEWAEYVISMAYELLKSQNFSPEIEKQFVSVSNYSRGLAHNALGDDRMATNPEYDFEYDVISWLIDKNNFPLNHFKLNSISKIIFKLTDEQFKIVQDNIEVYGNTDVGRSKALKMIPIQKLWRHPVIISK